MLWPDAAIVPRIAQEMDQSITISKSNDTAGKSYRPATGPDNETEPNDGTVIR